MHVAVVTRDEQTRALAARAFDRAPRTWRVTLEEAPPEGVDIVIAGPDSEIEGDIDFDPSVDTVAAVHAIVRARTRRSIRVGGLPGSGRTSVAVHLALAWAGSVSVCLVDPVPTRGASSRLAIAEPLVFASGDDPFVAAVPAPGGFRLLTCTEEEIDPDALLVHFERLVIDEPSLDTCDVVLMQPTVPQARRLRNELPETARPVIVSNRMGRGGESTRADLERVLGRRIALELPHSPPLRDAEDHGSFAPPWTRWWGGVMRLARALI